MMEVKLWSEGYKCTKTGIFYRTESVAMTLKIMCTYAHYVTLVSRCKMASSRLFQGISVSLSFWYHAVRLLLVIFILGESSWNCFQVGYPVDSPTISALKQTPFGIPS